MKKAVVLTLIILSLLTLDMVCVRPIKAQYNQFQEVAPPPGTPPIVLSMLSPQNNTAYNSSNVNINFTVSFNGDSSTTLFFVNFTDDWQTNATYAYKQNVTNPQFPHSISYSNSLTNIPKGNHSITIYAQGGGGYAANGLVWDYYDVQNSWIIKFSVEPTLSPAKPAPFPTALVATASGASAAVVCLGLLVYFKKHKR